MSEKLSASAQPYEYTVALQSDKTLNLVPSSSFTLDTYQGVISDGTYTTPLYSWYSSGTLFPQPIPLNITSVGETSLTSMVVQVFGPSGSLTGYTGSTLSEWVANPTTTYSNNYQGPTETYPGPSYASSVKDSKGTHSGVWSFNLQPVAPESTTSASYPIISAYGTCDLDANSLSCKRFIQTGHTDPKYWYKIGLLDGPLGQTLPVPYTKADGTTATENLRVVFATPYSPAYYNSNVFTGNNQTLPGYLVAFYQPSNLPANTYPVLFDPINIKNQAEYGSFSALTSLNTILGTEYGTLHDLFQGQGWLQDVLLPYSQGGTVSNGVDLGGSLGGGWFGLGLLSFNLRQQVSPNTVWAASAQSYQQSYLVQQPSTITPTTTTTTTSSTTTTTTTSSTSSTSTQPTQFCSGNATLGCSYNPNNTGNQFWISF